MGASLIAHQIPNPPGHFEMSDISPDALGKVLEFQFDEVLKIIKQRNARQ